MDEQKLFEKLSRVVRLRDELTMLSEFNRAMQRCMFDQQDKRQHADIAHTQEVIADKLSKILGSA